MSELGDYRRLIEAPMIAKYEATIKDWQDSSEAYRRDAEVAETRLAEAVEALRWLRAFWKPGSNHDTAEVQLALSQADRVLGAVGRSPERGEQS